MLTLKQIRDEREQTVARLAKKGVDAAPVIDRIVALDDRRKAIQQQLDGNLSEQNKIAKEIGGLFKSGKTDEANALKEKVAGLKEQSKALETEQADVISEMESLIVTLPNRPAEIVPEGKTAEDNLVVKMGGPEARQLKGEGILPHWELAKKYDIIDFEL
ncbi:MAG TPA: serine--tRNA ligase, partial [Rikenella microfusus]|nr:serine--tRNA ligase [Rikenella microfusus]